MIKSLTKKDVYDNINFFVFNEKALDTPEKVKRLRLFVDDLFDINIKSVYPFDDIITAHLRILFYIDGYMDIFNHYLNEGIDLREDYDIVEVSNKLYTFILYPERFIKNKTRA